MMKNEEDDVCSEIDDETSCEECESDDSEDDPSFDIEKEVRLSLSKLSVTRKSKSRVTKVTEEGSEENQDVVEDRDVPELGEEDQKSFEALQKKIEAGQLEKLKVDQCKVYLRKYGLRLTGNKETLLQRIKEHLEVIDGGGEKKYPSSSFVLNCKGDACTGDVVLFEQNVYNAFNIAYRSANGPPCGTRVIAGRIVKESYGAAKQQHTFTVEVLWSKGVKPLPPLHPLLIKGRNLYRLKTVRQKWENEGERQKILLEKHGRGNLARSTREVRMKETKRKLKTNRAPKIENPKIKIVDHSSSISSGNLGTQPHREPTSSCPDINLLAERNDQGRQFTSISFQNQNRGQSMRSLPLQNKKHGYGVETVQSQRHFQRPQGHVMNVNYNHVHLPRMPLTNMNGFRQTWDSHPFQQRQNFMQNGNLFQSKSFEKKQICVNYPMGRCYYGDHCKYLHENMENHKKQICVNYPLGRCYYGDHCKYLHENMENHKKQICVYYPMGRCYYGDHCKYLHENMEKP